MLYKKDIRLKFRFYITLLFVVICTHAKANYYCVGKVEYFGSSNTLSVSNGYGVHNLCTVDEDKCKLWASVILAAKLADRSISIYYQSADSQGGNQSEGVCNDIGHWVTPSNPPYHVQLH